MAAGVATQIELSRILADALPVPVPHAELAGAAGPWFPYPFAGHRVLRGTSTEALPWSDAELAAFARTFGAALTALHAIPTEGVRTLGVPVEPDRTPERRDGAIAISDAFRSAMPRDCVARWDRWLRGEVAPPAAWDGPLALTHNDLAAEHVLVDPASRRITGVFDWSDAAIGDPAMDLVGLWLWRGEPLVRRVLANYAQRWDERTIARVRFHAECLALLYVGRAQCFGDGALLERKRRSFLDSWEPLARR